MRETFTSGSVGGIASNRRFYPEGNAGQVPAFSPDLALAAGGFPTLGGCARRA